MYIKKYDNISTTHHNFPSLAHTSPVPTYLRIKARLWVFFPTRCLTTKPIRQPAALLSLNKRSPQPNTKIRRQYTRSQQDRQKYNKRNRETRSSHTNQIRIKRGIPNREYHSRWTCLCLRTFRFINSKSQIASRNNPNNPINPNTLQRIISMSIILISLNDFSRFSSPLIPRPTSSSLKISLKRQRWQSISNIRMSRMMIFQKSSPLRRFQQRCRFRTLFRAMIPTNLYRTLKVYLHRIRKFESLKMRIRQNRSACTKILNFRKTWHQLWSGNTTLLIDELYRCSLSIMSHTIPDQHIEFGVVILDR